MEKQKNDEKLLLAENGLRKAAKKFVEQNNLQNRKIVVGKGKKNPDILFIGEAPGKKENEIGKPFVGRSGEVLDKWINSLGGKTYAVINAIPIMPLDEQGKIRPPTQEEIDYFKPFVKELIASLNPKFIICVGKTAAKVFDKKFANKTWDDNIGFIYHPAYYLRNGTDGMQDFLLLISEKFGKEEQQEKSENFVSELSFDNIKKEDAFDKFINLINAKKISDNEFVYNNQKWFVDYHPFDHSDDIIIEDKIAGNYDNFLLIKSGSDRVRIVGWCNKEQLTSTPPRDIYRNGKNYFVVFNVNINDLTFFKIKPQKKYKEILSINRQQAKELGINEMTSELLAGLHFFAKQADVFFKDINTIDECIIDDKKAKIYTRDFKSDDDMLIYEDYFSSHPEIDIYILCKIRKNKLEYLGYITKEVVAETPIINMIGAESTTTSKDIRRIFSSQYLPMSNLIKIEDDEEEQEQESIREQPYVPLHVHSEHSVGDAFGTIKYLVESAKKKGFKALALTDHGTLGGAWKFARECLANDIKPIIGCELYVKLENSDKRFHTLVLVKNETGWKNLLLLQDNASRKNFYYKPIVKFDELLQHHEGLIITTGCMSSPIPTMIVKDMLDEAKQLMIKLKSVFGDDFYAEIQPHTIGNNQEVMQKLFAIANELNIKSIITTDSHYPNKEDKKYHEAIKAIDFNKSYGEAGYGDDVFHLMTDDDFYQHAEDRKQFSWAKPFLKIFFENTKEIADKVDFEITPPEENDTLPKFSLEKIASKELLNEFNNWNFYLLNKISTTNEKEKFFVFLIEKGLVRIGKNDDEVYIARAILEANRMIEKKYINYFLIVWELMQWCRKNNIMVGPGRGSVGSSLVAFLLNITKVNPLIENLLFDRFISEARKDAPDIDMDFQDDRRDEVFNHFRKLYGESHAAKIITYSRFHGKGVIRDVGRIFNIPISEVEKICNLMIVRSGGDARASFTVTDTFEEFEEARKFRQKYPDAVDIAIKLEGHIRHRGVHAAAMVVAEKPINNYVPTYKVGNEIVIEWEKALVEQMKLIKFDVLGLKTLTIINDAMKFAGIKELPFDFSDDNVFEVFRSGNTLGIFQFEGVGITKLAKEIGIKNFKELYDCTSLYRPGALHSGQAAVYVKRAQGLESTKPFHPLLTDITKHTKGIVLYQEQIMQIMHDVGNLSWATAEMSRKIMTKSKGAKEFNKVRSEFVRNAVKFHGLEENDAQKLFDVVSTFGCLAGDAIVYRPSSNQYESNEITIRKLYELQKTRYRWKKPMLLAMSADGMVRPHRIKQVHYTGKQKVKYIKTNTGKSIRATDNHYFIINGKWQKLEKAKIGDWILTTTMQKVVDYGAFGVGKGSHTACPRFKKGKGKTNEEKRQRQKLIKIYGACQICGSKENLEMHHFNGDHSDNSDKNTILVCRKCHHSKMHDTKIFSRFKNGYPVVMEKVVSIVDVGIRDTYDIEMDGAPRNFIANGFVSHNSYGFNQSHATEYSMISYWTAWLKKYHTAAFYAALLKHETDKKKVFSYMQAAEQDGVSIEFPHINYSSETYNIVGNKIYAGFNVIDGIAGRTAEKIVKNQPYENYEDFIKRTKPSKKVLKGLIIADAFRDFNINKKVCYFAEKLPSNPYDKLSDDFSEQEYIKLLMKHTSLKPKISIQETYNFDDLPYVDIGFINKQEHANKQLLLRGIITEVANKDKLIRGGYAEHEHNFEKHLYYLNLNDGTGDIALQVLPHTYTKYKDIVAIAEKKPVIALVTISFDGLKASCDMIKMVGEKDEEFDATINAFLQKDNKQVFITSAIPNVSKNKKHYYRLKLSNGDSGLLFGAKERVFPGMIIAYNKFNPPFINAIKIEKN